MVMSGWTLECWSTQLCSLRHLQSLCSDVCHKLHWVCSLSHHPLASLALTGGARPFSRCGLTHSRSITPAHTVLACANSWHQLQSSSKPNLSFHPGPERDRHCCLAAHAAGEKQPQGGKCFTASHPFPCFCCHSLCEKNLLCRNKCLVQVLPALLSQAAGGQKRTPSPPQHVTTSRKQTTGVASLNAIQIKPRAKQEVLDFVQCLWKITQHFIQRQ